MDRLTGQQPAIRHDFTGFAGIKKFSRSSLGSSMNEHEPGKLETWIGYTWTLADIETTDLVGLPVDKLWGDTQWLYLCYNSFFLMFDNKSEILV